METAPQAIHGVAESVGGGLAGWLVTAIGSGLIGLVVGGVVVGLVHLLPFKRAH